MKLQYFRSRRVQFVLVGLAVFLLFSGCINPFSGNDDSDSASGARGDGTRYGSIVINPGGGLTAQTVAPDLSNLKSLIDTYNVTLTNTLPGSLAPITVNGYVEGTSIDDVPYGTWDISLVGTSGGTQIATATVTGFVVAAATNPVTMDLQPSAIGNGTLDYTLSFPAADVDGAVVVLDPWPAGGGDELTLASGTDYNADFGTTGSLTISGTYASNVYLMTIQLSDSTASGNGNHAPVVKIVQIFDELATTASDTITIAELRSPPDPPTNMVVEFTGENAFSISWTDASNTEQGFRVYDDPAAATALADITNGSGIATGLSDAGYTPGIAEDVTYRVVAYNQFGESAPLDFSFRVLPTAQMPNHVVGAANLGPGWVAASAPGTLNWATLIVGGGTGLNIYTSTINDLTDVTNLPPATASGPAPPWNLTNIGGLTPLETYNWRFEAVDGTNRVFFPVQQFTVRDGILYVSAANTGGVDGSETDPVPDLSPAVNASLSGEEVRIAEGTYAESITIDQPLTVTGGWNGSFTAASPTATPSTITGTTTSIRAINVPGSVGTGTVVIDGVTVTTPDYGGATRLYGIEARGGNVTVVNSTVGTSAAATEHVGIYGDVAASLTVRDSTIEMAAPGTQTGIWINSISGPVVIERNRINLETTLDALGIGVLARNSATIENNVILQSGTFTGNQTFRNIDIDGNGATDATVTVRYNTIANRSPNRNVLLRAADGLATSTLIAEGNILDGGTVATIRDAFGIFSGATLQAAHGNAVFNTDIGNVGVNLGQTVADFVTFNEIDGVWGNYLIDPNLGTVGQWLEPQVGYDPRLAGAAPYLVGSEDITQLARTRPATPGAFEVANPAPPVPFAGLASEQLFTNVITFDGTAGDTGPFGLAFGPTNIPSGPQPPGTRPDRNNINDRALNVIQGQGVEIEAASPGRTVLNDYSSGQTVSFWMTVPVFQGRILSRRYPSNESWEINYFGDELRLVYNGVFSGTVTNAEFTTGAVNGWSHVVAIFSPDTTELYVNNTRYIALDTSGSPRTYDTTQPVRLGRTDDGLVIHEGAEFGFDDLRIYERILTPEEIQLLYLE